MSTRFPIPPRGTLLVRRFRRALCVLVSCSLCSTACASLMNGRTQVVAVSSDPPGAEVTVDEEVLGVTPTFVDLSRGKGNPVLRLEKEGFEPLDVPVGRSPSGWLWADAGYAATTGLMAGQAIGHRGTQWTHTLVQAAAFAFGIDLLTGAAFKLPHHIQATLERTPFNPGPRAEVDVPPPSREGLLLPTPFGEWTGDAGTGAGGPRGRER